MYLNGIGRERELFWKKGICQIDLPDGFNCRTTTRRNRDRVISEICPLYNMYIHFMIIRQLSFLSTYLLLFVCDVNLQYGVLVRPCAFFVGHCRIYIFESLKTRYKAKCVAFNRHVHYNKIENVNATHTFNMIKLFRPKALSEIMQFLLLFCWFNCCPLLESANNK